MATVNGTAGDDFIHRDGDGLVVPPGYTEILGVTTGDDTIDGFNSGDILYGDDGNDTLNGGSGNDTLHGGAGADNMDAGSGTDTLDGGTGNDFLQGASGTDTLIGGDGDDRLNGGADADAMTGGAGNDIYVVAQAGDTVTELAGGGTDLVESSITYTLSAEVENMTLTGGNIADAYGNGLANVLTGNTVANSLQGGGGNDTLDGGNGTDTLNGGTGADTMIGGTGNDTYVVDDAGDSVTELIGQGTDLVYAFITYTLGAEVENLTLLGTANIDAYGNGLANILSGNTGNNSLQGGGIDTLIGGDGNDTLNGGAGADAMTGGTGNDAYVVDDAGDTVTELPGGGTDLVYAYFTYTIGAQVENLTLLGTANIDAYGNGFANILTGNTGNNSLQGGGGTDTLSGGDGNDMLNGGTGADAMTGGTGNDAYIVNDTGDTVTELAGGGTDTVRTFISHTLGPDVEHLVLIGTANIDGTGNALGNSIFGNTGNNLLFGLDGNDILKGGGGADQFVYAAGGSGTDIVTDFSGITAFGGGVGEGDKFTFNDLLQGAFAYRGDLSFTATGNTEARVSAGQVLLDADGNGVSDIAISVTGLINGSQLIAADFLFVST